MKKIAHHRIRRTTYIIVLLLALLGGLYIAKLTDPLSALWLLLPIALLPLIVKRGFVLVAYLLLAGFLFGWWRGGILQAANTAYNQLFYDKVTILARATEDSFYADNG